MRNNYSIIAGTIVFLLLLAFLWSTHQILSPILVGGFLLFFLLTLKEYPFARQLSVGVTLLLLIWFFAKAKGLIFPFVASFVIAYLFAPIADWLEKKGIPRTIGILFLILFTIGIMVLAGIILIPGLVKEIQDLINRIPNIARQVTTAIQKDIPKLLAFLKVNPAKLQQSLLKVIPSKTEQILSNLLKGITGVGAFLGQILNVILIPILTFYFLKDFEQIKEWALDFVPRKYRSSCFFYLWRSNRILGGYIRGQLIVCTIVGILTGLGLAIFNIPFAILLGVTAGVLNVIPYIGLYTSLALALLAGFFTPNVLASMLKIGGVFFIVQMLEAYIISPKIVGKRVGLHPVAVIFSILVFAKFLGFWGLVIGVPTAALIKFIMDEWKRRRKWREILAEKTITND